MEKVKISQYNVYIDEVIQDYDFYFDSINQSNRLFVITDETVFNLYQSTFLSKTKREVFWFILEPGDKSKNVDNLLKISRFLFDKDFKRNDIITSFGGGMVNDITGMAASLYYRGVNLIHIPTSLIGQVDSSIGGKTGVNFDYCKNVLGTFYDPRLVLIETNYLKTLPKREITNGLGELIKAGFIGDEKIIKTIEKTKDAYLNPKLIKRAIELKKNFVESDYYDRGARHVLNLGHTFGHAIESASNFNISHGEAVIMGMIKALEIGEIFGLTKPSTLKRLKDLLVEIDFELPNVEYKDYQNFLQKDKKSFEEGIKLTVLEDIGEPAIVEISWEKLNELAHKKE